MAQQTFGDSRPAQNVYVGPVIRETLALILTLVLGIVLVALIIFAPYVFLARAPLAGVGPRYSLGLAEWLDYGAKVRAYVLGVFGGSLGVDNRGFSVNRTLIAAAIRTLQLLAISAAAAVPLGLAWGGLLAVARRRVVQAALFGLNTLLNSLPSFVLMLLALEAVSNLTLRTGVRLTYVQGYGLDRHLVLPTAVLALRGGAYMARAIQVAHEDIMREDWIRAARAKGLGGLALWRRHVLPALRLPLLGSTLGMIRVVVGGLVIVDYLYNWNGLGSYMLKSVGIISPRIVSNQIAAGAAVLLVCLFVGVDAIGRLVLRNVDPRLRSGASE